MNLIAVTVCCDEKSEARTHIASDGGQLPGTESIALGRIDRMLAATAAIVPVQLLAWRLAVDRGFQPGTYNRASKITTHE